jgi:hypothetical protein
MSSIEGTAATITNVGTATENQTDKNGLLIDRFIVKPIRHVPTDLCPKGYINTPNGDCKPRFSDK